MRIYSKFILFVLVTSGVTIPLSFNTIAKAADAAAPAATAPKPAPAVSTTDKPVPADDTSKCTRPVPIDTQVTKGETGKTYTFPDTQRTPQDRICFGYITYKDNDGNHFVYSIIEKGPEAPLLTWSDVSQTVSSLSISAPETPSKKSKNNTALDRMLEASVQPSPGDTLKSNPMGDPDGYSLQIGYSITAQVTDKDSHNTWQITVEVPYSSTPWKMFFGATATSGRWDSAYSLQATTPSGESRIQDVSRSQWDPSRVYGSLFWIRDYNNTIFNPAVGFGLNGGHPSAFAGFGTMFGGVGLIYGLALAPTDVLTPQYQHVYDTRGKVPSKTSVGSLTTKSYRPTIFVGLGVTFCISSCPTKVPAQATNSKPAAADKPKP